ncbi:MAG: exodeoxyribonuclease VII large subunit [Gammaproteobacteria bacterium]
MNDTTIYTVSELNRSVRFLLEQEIPLLWVEGELSNVKRLSSGHFYFSLKDATAQLRCALFRSKAQTLKTLPQDGMHVVLKGKLSLYEERGDFQLIVEHLEDSGEGRLQRAFQQLKEKLSQMGLFSPQHKKPLPAFPRCIGVVTSPTGAAIRDILSVLKRRFASIPVIIYPTLVQGQQAAEQIVAAITLANQRRECDVLILARGGGSLEDLWGFNEEIVAQAIFASDIPLISGIGHEIDVTIADFVADSRAATPSAAAELVSPDKSHYLTLMTRLKHRLQRHVQGFLQQQNFLIQMLAKRLSSPAQRLRQQAQRLDELEQRLRLAQHNILRNKKASLAQLLRALEGVSPLNTLKRGYAIVTREGHVVSETQAVQKDSRIQIRLVDGVLEAIVV